MARQPPRLAPVRHRATQQSATQPSAAQRLPHQQAILRQARHTPIDMAPACILLPALGPAELLPADTCARDVLGPGPLLRAAAAGSRGAAVAWANPHAHAEHNEPASRIAGQAVRGDACLLLQEASPSDVQQLLAGRPPRRAAATAAAPAAAPAAAAVAPCKRPHLEPDPAAAAADAGGEPAARGCGDVADSARWQDLPAHVISAVALKAGGTVAGAMPVYGTCRCVGVCLCVCL